MKTSVSLRATALSFFIMLCFPFCLFSQNNLVPNPSFEEYDLCPDEQGQVYRAKYWNSFGNSPDYFNSCSPLWEYSTPNNLIGYQYAYNGNSYIGAVTFSTYDTTSLINENEYIGTKLLEPLAIGQKYFVNLYVSLSELAGASNSNLGVLFTTKNFSVDSFCPQPCIGFSFLEPNYAHVYYTQIISDSINWTNISGSFIADSAYEYIIIGNFFSNNIQYDTFPSPNGNVAYYYIDNIYVGIDSVVSVSEYNTLAKKTKIFPNPATNNLTISLSNQIRNHAIVEITVLDILGNELIKHKTDLMEINIPIEGLSAGQYFVKINSANDYSMHKIIIFN
jgi:hypothetical protein